MQSHIMQPVFDTAVGAGEETGAHPPHATAQPQIHTGRLDLFFTDSHTGFDASCGDQAFERLGGDNTIHD